METQEEKKEVKSQAKKPEGGPSETKIFSGISGGKLGFLDILKLLKTEESEYLSQILPSVGFKTYDSELDTSTAIGVERAKLIPFLKRRVSHLLQDSPLDLAEIMTTLEAEIMGLKSGHIRSLFNFTDSKGRGRFYFLQIENQNDLLNYSLTHGKLGFQLAPDRLVIRKCIKEFLKERCWDEFKEVPADLSLSMHDALQAKLRNNSHN